MRRREKLAGRRQSKYSRQSGSSSPNVSPGSISSQDASNGSPKLRATPRAIVPPGRRGGRARSSPRRPSRDRRPVSRTNRGSGCATSRMKAEKIREAGRNPARKREVRLSARFDPLRPHQGGAWAGAAPVGNRPPLLCQLRSFSSSSAMISVIDAQTSLHSSLVAIPIMKRRSPRTLRESELAEACRPAASAT